jgi:hypothetical protein
VEAPDLLRLIPAPLPRLILLEYLMLIVYYLDSLSPPINQEAIKPVNIPNKPTPVVIKTAAIALPSVVTGNLSPYPTVVIVTKAHQIASSAV